MGQIKNIKLHIVTDIKKMAPNMEAESEDQKVKKLTSAYPEHFEIIRSTVTTTKTTSEGEQGEGERHKVLCKLTKHELPLNAAAIETYINGKKFQTYLSKVRKPGALVQKLDEKYASLFRPSKKFPATRLYCTLTRKEINKQPHDVEKYIPGYKFRKALDKQRQRKEKGEPEPELEEEEEEKEPADADADGEAMEDPFYALSSEGEEEVEEDDRAGDMEDNEEVIDEEEAVEEIAEDDDENNISKCESKNTPSAAAVAEALCKNISESSGSGSGKKRKSKSKKDKKKNKKLKAAGL